MGTAVAQTLRVRVIDETNGMPVADARVHLMDGRGTEIVEGALGSDGSFAHRVQPGSYSLRVIRLGHAPAATGEFVVEPGIGFLEVEVLISAGPIAVLLPKVVVTGDIPTPMLRGFQQRRADGFGNFLTRDEFEEWHPRAVTDVLRRMHSVKVRPNTASGRGRNRDYRRYIVESSRPTGGLGGACSMLFFVDGIYIGNGSDTDIDLLLPVGDVDAIEVYSGAAQMPARFNRTGSACGVILFWTSSSQPDVSDEHSMQEPLHMTH